MTSFSELSPQPRVAPLQPNLYSMTPPLPPLPNHSQGRHLTPTDQLDFSPGNWNWIYNTVGSDPEFARYVAGVSQAMQQKRQVQHGRRPGNPRGHWPPMDDAHRTWPFPEFFAEGWVLDVGGKLSLGPGCSPWGLCAPLSGSSFLGPHVREWHMVKFSGGQSFVTDCRMPSGMLCPYEDTIGINWWFLRQALLL